MARIREFRFTITIAILILVALLLPGSTFRKMPKGLFELDKIAHLLLFFAFTVAFQVESRNSAGKPLGFMTGVAVIAIFALGSETLQLTTNTRSFDLRDMAFDLAGALLAFITVTIASALTARRNRQP